MKRLVMLTAALLLTTDAAFADPTGVKGSKHDFSNATGSTIPAPGNGVNPVKAVAGADTTEQICIYCHTPHHATQSRALWNHQTSGVTHYNWDSTSATIKGTPLGFDAAGHTSTLCLSCHDGSIAIGQLGNAGNGAPGTVPMSGDDQAGGFLKVGAAGNLSNAAPVNNIGDVGHNHPFAIPYAGQTYMTVTSAAALVDGYQPPVNGKISGAANGGGQDLYLTSGGDGYGVECATCHEPHRAQSFSHMLRDDLSGSKLCFDCHLK